MRFRWTDWLILAFLAFQLAAPLTYYLRADRYDERFAWRMFSGVRLDRCSSRAANIYADEPGTDGRTSTRRIVDPRKEVHAGWVTLLRRNRRVVVERFLERQCEQPNATSQTADGLRPTETQLTNRCVAIDGKPRPNIEYSMNCGSRVMTIEGDTEGSAP